MQKNNRIPHSANPRSSHCPEPLRKRCRSNSVYTFLWMFGDESIWFLEAWHVLSFTADLFSDVSSTRTPASIISSVLSHTQWSFHCFHEAGGPCLSEERLQQLSTVLKTVSVSSRLFAQMLPAGTAGQGLLVHKAHRWVLHTAWRGRNADPETIPSFAENMGMADASCLELVQIQFAQQNTWSF